MTGSSRKKVRATAMNAVSSRSHTIFSILCDSLNTNTSVRSIGKLSFVDLAVEGKPLNN